MTTWLTSSKHEDVLKWAEKEGKHISYDDAVEIVVFSGVIRPGKNQVLIAIVIQPSFLPESRILTEQSQVMDTPVIDRDCHRPPADDDSTGPGTRKRERGDSPPRKRQKAGRRPDGTHEMGTDTKLDPSILGQQPLVKIVRDVSNSTFQTGDIICLDEHDTLCVRKAYTAMVWIRYRVETTMAIEQ